MSLSRKCQIGFVVACLLISSAGSACGQSDAEKAFEAARIAFDGRQFDEARDLLISAAQTDAKNPDIHLLLGKAHYQLGEVGEAMAAWRATLRFAPQQAYAKRMLKVLSGQSLDVKTHLQVVDALLGDRMYKPIPAELARIRSQALTSEQRLSLLLLESEYHLGVLQPQSALRSMGELAVRFPDQQETPKAQLLLARARVNAGGELLASGLEILEVIAKEQVDTPLGPAAQLELIAFRLRQRTVGIGDLLAWIEKNKNHSLRIRARDELVISICGLLSDKAQSPILKADSPLTADDQQALAAAATAYAALTTAEDASALTTQLIQHLETYYVAATAFDAASAGLEALEKIQMFPSSSQLVVAARRRLTNTISTAQYNDIVAALAQSRDETAALNDWIEQHPDHVQVAAARQALLNWYLAATLRQEKPTKASPLAATDTAAIQVAADIFENSEVTANTALTAEDASALTTQLIQHLETYYVAAKAFDAASAGMEALEKIQMFPSSSQLVVAARRRLTNTISTAQYNEIVAVLAQSRDETAALNDWIEQHPDHVQVAAARQALLNWYLAATLRQKKPTKVSPLAATDTAAIQVAADIFENSEVTAGAALTAEEAAALTTQLIKHLETHYVAAKAFDAASAGLEALEKIQMFPSSSQLVVAARRRLTDTISTAQYNEIVAAHARSQDETAALNDWIEQHPDHAQVAAARQALLNWYLAATLRAKKPTKDSPLAETDTAAIQVASGILEKSEVTANAALTAKDASALTTQLIQHLEKHYVAVKAFDAASAGLEALEKIQMFPSSSQLVIAARRRLTDTISTAQYNDIVAAHARTQNETAALQDWIDKHGDHAQVAAARQALLNWYLAATLRAKKPTRDSALAETDAAAIQVAAGILEKSENVANSAKLVDRLAAHVQKRYVVAGAWSAASTAYENLLAIDPPEAGRVKLLHSLASVQTQIVLARLGKDATEQQIVAGELPDDLTAVLATFDKINTLVPAAQTWKLQAALAVQVASLSPRLQWPTLPDAAKPTQAWAVEIALPVIADRSDAEAVKTATTMVNGIVDELAGLPQPTADQLAIALQNKIVATLPENENEWIVAMLKQADLQAALAKRVFNRNTEAGLRDLNKELSDPQKQLIATLKTLVTSRPSQAAAVVGKLESALSQHLVKGHFDVVEEAYAELQADLPAPQQFNVELAMIRISIQQIIDRDERTLARGYRVDAELDPQVAKGLVRVYQIQRGIPDEDPRIASARLITNSIVDHYREMDMFAVAEQAIRTKADEGVAVADKYAEFQQAELKLFLAQREQTQLLKTFRGREKITFTPAFEAAQTAYQAFVTRHPSDSLAGLAVERLFGIGQLFESNERGQLAAAVFADIEKFSATVKQLGQADVGLPTTAERASLAAAIALHNDASRALTKLLEKQPSDADPPVKVSEEFARAIRAYQSVIVNSPDGPLVNSALSRMLAIGLQYAKTGAWDVADSVYDGVLAQNLPLQSPERIEFARALCQVGKVMPAHAEEMLGALSQTTLPGRDGDKSKPEGESGKISQLALAGGGFGGGRTDELFRFTEELESSELNEGISNVLRDHLLGSTRRNGPNAQPGSVPKTPDPSDVADREIALDAPALSAEDLAIAVSEARLLASVQHRQGHIATRLAQIDDQAIQFTHAQPRTNSSMQQASTVLSKSEIARQARLLDAAYALLQDLRKRYPTTSTAQQARGEIAVMIEHWRELSKWERSAEMAAQFLADNPTDPEFPNIRQDIARDYLSWAALGVEKNGSKQAMLDTVTVRFEKARTELTTIVTDFPEDDALRQQAQWDIANSFLTQARVVATLSPTLARGQFVRSANELMQVAERYHDHPQIGTIPQMLANIANELAGRTYHDEAISVWNLLSINYPMHTQGQAAALRIAQTYQSQKQPLRAMEAYVELNFARGGNDQAMQNAIYQIATSLKAQQRWVETLHVLESFVDSFPEHPQAGQALTMIGEVHQTNEVWEDAIAAYDRVITEYDQCEWVKQARWSIAECTINLSRWNEAIEHYRKFSAAYAKDPQTVTATQRIDILKDLARFQNVVDEKGQRKSFDAQYQIAEVVREKLSNQVKAIIEYRKVATRWPKSHLADDALYQVGTIYLARGETEKARDALLAAAEDYPSSPLADDALFLVGQSFENEAQKFAAVTRDTSAKDANDLAQKYAYKKSQALRSESRGRQQSLVSKLKQEGNFEKADEQVAINAVLNKSFDYANAQVISQWAEQEAQALSAAQLADRQDKVNAALRKAVASYRRAATLVSGDKADDALLRMAQIYDERLKDADMAMETWLEIVKQFSGTSVAENASWKIAQYYEKHSEYAKAIDAYQSFLRNYRRSPNANVAQAAIAENYEHLGKWVEAMDAYANYLTNFPKGPRLNQAKQQINWIKTYRL